MRKLSIRRRGKHGDGTTAYEVGEAGTGPSVVVTAAGRREALAKAKPQVRALLARESVEAVTKRADAKAERRGDRQAERARRERAARRAPA